MAAATPGRPSLCIVPSNDVLLLAEELQGLGGNDIALAKSTLFSLEDAANGTAEEVARWLAEGFSATLAPAGGGDLEAATTFLQHVVARMHSSLHLALSWAHASPTKALNCIGTAVSPVVGLRGAPAVRFSHVEALDSILQVAYQSSQSTGTIITLSVFNPADSTLASLNLILCNGKDSAFNLMELMAEVTELHAKRHAGEHILLSSRLGLLNHLAAPLIAGNARLFIPRGGCPLELENRIEVIKAVCTRAQVPASDLKWIDVQIYLEASKARQQQVQQQVQQQQQQPQQTPAVARSSQGPTSSSDAASVERRRQQRARVSSSLQRAAALGAARLSSSSSVKFKSPEEERENTHSNGNDNTASGDACSLSSSLPDGPNTTNTSYEPVQETAAAEEEFSASSTKAAIKLQQPAVRRSVVLPVTKGIAELTSPSGAVCYGSPSPAPNNSKIDARGHAPAPAAAAGSKTGNTINSYAAAFKASHPSLTPSFNASLSLGRNGVGQAQEENAVPATAALQRRLWASSTAMPPVTDVFQSGSFAFDAGHDEQPEVDHHHQGENNGAAAAEELQFDLSEQAAAVASSVARARGAFTSSYYSSQKEEGEECVEEHARTRADKEVGQGVVLETDGNSNAYEHTYSSYDTHNNRHTHDSAVYDEADPSTTTSTTVAIGELAAELEKERRVNSVLLKQLQEAQERAARATAAAASVPPIENIEPGDFNGVLTALQHERQRNVELGQQAQRAAEAQLALEVELVSAQQENAITRARCRALERGTSLATAFAQCEAAVKSAEGMAQRLQKENFDLARAVAEAELSSLVKSAIGDNANPSMISTLSDTSDTGAVIATLHKKLNLAHGQIRKLQDEVAAQQAKVRAAESALRGADVSRRTAEDALRRNAALQEALLAAESRAEEQCLAAAEALAAAEELQRERDEFVAALEAEQERGDQLLDLAESFRLRAQVGAAHAYNINNTSSEARSLFPVSTQAATTSAYS